MDNDNFSFLADAESSITGDKTEGYTPKEQELIHQLVQERLGKKNAIEFESLDDYVVAAERHCRKTDGAVCRRQPRLFGASRIGLRSGRRPLLGEIKPLHHPGQFVPYGHQ